MRSRLSVTANLNGDICSTARLNLFSFEGEMLAGMSVMCASLVLLCTAVADILLGAATTTSPADQPLLSPRHYQYTDPDLGTQLVCDKCPAGTYVSLHCSATAVRECSPCPEGTFTRGENGVQQCHRCRAPCPAGMVEKMPCKATQDRVCACPPESFASGEGGGQCRPHSVCPLGMGVKRRGSETEDVRCKPCARGTFSNVESSVLKCRAHTNCQAQGLVLFTPGTKETDNICGAPSTSPSSSSSSSPSRLTTPLGSAPSAFVQNTFFSPSSSSSSLLELVHKGAYSQSAAIRQRQRPEEDQHAKALLLSRAATPVPPEPQKPDQHPQRTLSPPVRKYPITRQHHRGHMNTDPLPAPNKRAMEGLEDGEAMGAGVGISRGGVQGSGGGGGGFVGAFKPTRRGSPRPSTHGHFDINEHLPWMIVLLLLLVLVVIVVCSVKRSSRVLKKGPRQDPSSIMEKAIQKKPSPPPAQVKEKWIYYSNGQEKKDTVLRQVRLDPCDLQPIFDDMLHILNPDELHVIEEIPAAEDKLDRLFEIAGVKSQEASQTLLDSVYSHLPDLL
ncbi:tumor necrosis factor receptor superfamily member 21 [Lampris incognitus]|uniref:tumor necrosis factor receptor superfamily member 21 n=1 Tax=Lampris incognitus TaxID=2546036 RepID=UPI0024B5C00D|nr:tumor necrosis factor receptor superfamily member 21 [Lampris incognitus]